MNNKDWSVFDAPVWTSSSKEYKAVTLDLPAGPEKVRIRLFPIVEVPALRYQSEGLFVYIPGTRSDGWRRKMIGYRDAYPSAFAAWDGAAGEWALHQPGKSSVTDEPEPPVRPSPVRYPIIRGESETVNERKPKRKRRSFAQWWSDLGHGSREPDFLKERRDRAR